MLACDIISGTMPGGRRDRPAGAGLLAVPMDELIGWAYRQELCKIEGRPKRHKAPNGLAQPGIYAHAGLRSGVNRFGCVPDDFTSAEPHGDALVVASALDAFSDESLGRMVVEGDLLPDLSDLSDDERRDCHVRGLLGARLGWADVAAAALVHARLGRQPVLSPFEPIERQMVRNRQGGPAWFRKVPRTDRAGNVVSVSEVDGYNPTGKRPYPGAYRKFRLAPDPARIVAERAEYRAWLALLGCLADALDGQMSDHRAIAPAAHICPWESAVASDE